MHGNLALWLLALGICRSGIGFVGWHQGKEHWLKGGQREVLKRKGCLASALWHSRPRPRGLGTVHFPPPERGCPWGWAAAKAERLSLFFCYWQNLKHDSSHLEVGLSSFSATPFGWGGRVGQTRWGRVPRYSIKEAEKLLSSGSDYCARTMQCGPIAL